MTKSMKRIHRVVIKRMEDESPDTSWLGEYSNNWTSEYSIDRTHALDCPEQEYSDPTEGYECNCSGGARGRGEYRYFNPSFNYVDKGGRRLPENTDEEVREHMRQDYERMESLNRGDWCFLGIRADAELWIPNGIGSGTVQLITSGGLWGVESDSGYKYIAEVEQEQLAELREQLTAIGFNSRAISAAFKNVRAR